MKGLLWDDGCAPENPNLEALDSTPISDVDVVRKKDRLVYACS